MLRNSSHSFRSQCRVRSFENSSAPFNIEEYDVVWKDPKYYPWNFQRYLDWTVRRGSSPSLVFEVLTIELI